MPDHLDTIVEQWRRERPDVDVTPLALMGRLLRAAQLSHDSLAAGLAEHDLQRGWFDLLAALRRAGEPYELNPTALMEATMVSSAGITKRLDRLVDAGLVERRPDPADRRGTLVRLTSRGKAAIDAALPQHVANEARLLDVLSPAEQRQLDGLLRVLLARLDG